MAKEGTEAKELSPEEQWDALATTGENPMIKAKDADSESEEEQEEESEEEESEEKKDDKKKNDSEEEEEEESEESEEESEEEESEEEEEESEEKEDKSKDKPSDIDAEIGKLYSEKYSISNQKELEEVLSNVDDVLALNEDLLKENEELKKAPKEPEFANEAQKSAFNFIKDLNPENYQAGLESWAKIVSMNPDKMDNRLLLEELYVQKHPKLSRDDAQFKFNEIYEKKYKVNKEDFEDDAAYQRAKRSADIDLKNDVEEAKEWFDTKKKELAFKPSEKKNEQEKPEPPAAVKKSIKENLSESEKYFTGLKGVTFFPDDKNEDDKFDLALSASEVKEVKKMVDGWMSNPANYNEKGELPVIDDVEKAVQRAVGLLYQDRIISTLYDHAKQVVSAKRVEELSSKHPKRKSKTGTASVKNLSVDDQFAMHAQKKAS